LKDSKREKDMGTASGQRAAQGSLLETGKAFMDKFGKDWGMNLCGLLAYNFLGAIFPLLLGVLALSTLFLPPTLVREIGSQLNGAIPAVANGQNGLNIDFNNVLDNFRRASGLTSIVSLLALLWAGSSLFGVMENCFSIIFRTKDRDFVWQKLMCLLMIVIFAVLTPLSFVSSSISGSYQQLTHALGNLPGLGLLFAAGGYAIGVAFAFALFLLIYVIVPNMNISPANAWRGALAAAVLFEAATLVFPVYTTNFAGKSQFGAIAGLLAILTLWFWVISLILILGAEVNSFFALGQRATNDGFRDVLQGRPRVVEDIRPSAQRVRS
jgi:membrane protein